MLREIIANSTNQDVLTFIKDPGCFERVTVTNNFESILAAIDIVDQNLPDTDIQKLIDEYERGL